MPAATSTPRVQTPRAFVPHSVPWSHGGRHAAAIGGEKEKGARAEGDVRRGVCMLVGDGEEAVWGQVHPLSAQWGTCAEAWGRQGLGGLSVRGRRARGAAASRIMMMVGVDGLFHSSGSFLT